MVIHNHSCEVCIYEVILIDCILTQFLFDQSGPPTIDACRQSQIVISIQIQMSSFKNCYTCTFIHRHEYASLSCRFYSLINNCSQHIDSSMIDKVITFVFFSFGSLFLYKHKRLNIYIHSYVYVYIWDCANEHRIMGLIDQTDYCK